MRLKRFFLGKAGLYIFPVLTGLVLAGLTFYILVPKIRELVDNYQQLDQKRQQLTKLQKKRLLLESTGSDLSVKLLQLAETALPQEKDAASILVALENLSVQTQFGIETVSFTPGAVSSVTAKAKSKTSVSQGQATLRKGAQALEINVTTRGNTSQFLEFTRNLQAVRRIFDIISINVSYLADSPDILTADFNLAAYFLPPVLEITEVEEDLPQLTADEQKLLENLTSLPYISNTLVNSQNLPQLPKRPDLFTP